MEEQIKQRRSERYPCESPIVCSSLNGRRVYLARPINLCDSGISFITHPFLTSGMTIFFRANIHTQKRIAARPCRTMRGAVLAQVRGCRPLGDKNSVGYCVGAEYVEPCP